MNKKIITIISSLLAFIIIVAGGLFFYNSFGKNNIKAEHEKYLTQINDSHDFDGGLKGLESLDNDKGQETFKNIKTEIKIAKELKNTDTSLDNKDIDSAKKSLEKVDTLTTDNSFDKAIDWLKEDITNYEKALNEINEAKADDVGSILDRYKFNHSALKAKLSEIGNTEKKETVATEKRTTEIERKEIKSERKNSMGMTIPDNVTNLQQEWKRRGGNAEMLSAVKDRYKNAVRITTNYNSFHQENPDNPITIYIEMKNGTAKTAEFNYLWISGSFGGYVIYVYEDESYITVNET